MATTDTNNPLPAKAQKYKDPRKGSSFNTDSDFSELVSKTVTYKPFGSEHAIELSMAEIMSTIANPTKSGQLPSEREVMLCLKLCQHRGLNPYVGDVFLLGYDTSAGPKFSTIVSHSAMIKRADANDQYAGMRCGVICYDKERRKKVRVKGEVVPEHLVVIGGWCQVLHKSRQMPVVEASMKAYNKGRGHWDVDPNWMICKCAQAKAFRLAFPNDLDGLEIREEVAARHVSDESPAPKRRMSRRDKKKVKALPMDAPASTDVDSEVVSAASEAIVEQTPPPPKMTPWELYEATLNGSCTSREECFAACDEFIERHAQNDAGLKEDAAFLADTRALELEGKQ